MMRLISVDLYVDGVSGFSVNKKGAHEQQQSDPDELRNGGVCPMPISSKPIPIFHFAYIR
jgi:hypothetical protein